MKTKKGRVPKTRGGGTMTEAAFWSFIKAALRAKSRFWKPIHQTKLECRRKNQSSNTRLKFEYQCAKCGGWFPDKETVVDHIVPVGRLSCYEDLPGVVKRLFVERDGLQCLCSRCHHVKTQQDLEQIRAND